MRKWIGIAGLVVALLALTEGANAATDTARIQVSVQVIPNCRINVTDLAFGAYDPLLQHATQPLDGTANMSVLCTKDLRANLLLDDRQNADRVMHSGDASLTYRMFSDSARTRSWSTGANAVQIIGTGSIPQTFTVYGRVPGAQVVPAGWYTDAVTATVDF